MNRVNEKMYILAGLGIIGVVLLHVNGSEMSSIFPRWRMPMFVMMSGFFFVDDLVFTDFIKNKFKKLILPTAGYVLMYGMLGTVLLSSGYALYGTPIDVFNYFNNLFLTNGQFQFAQPLWFVSMLFYTQCVYVFLRRCFSNFKKLDLLLLCILFVFHILAIKFIQNGYQSYLYPNLLIPLYYAGFNTIFYHIGFCYRKYISELDSFNILKLIFPICVNIVLFSFCIDENVYIKDINSAENWILSPLVISLSGTYFYLHLSQLLAKSYEGSKLLVYIGKKSYAIMTHHFFGFFCINIVFLFLFNLGLIDESVFNLHRFYWYMNYRVAFPEPFCTLFYISFLIFISVFIDNILQSVLSKIKELSSAKKFSILLLVLLCVGYSRFSNILISVDSKEWEKICALRNPIVLPQEPYEKKIFYTANRNFIIQNAVIDESGIITCTKNIEKYVFYGPYINVPVGTYDITLVYKVLDGKDIVGLFDVSANNGNDMLGKGYIYGDLQKTTLTDINFTDKNSNRVEFRVFQFSDTKIKLSHIEVVRVK